MDIQITSFLKTRWGLEWIRFRRPPISFTIASEFVRNVGIDLVSLSSVGFSIIEDEGVGNLAGLITGAVAALQRKQYGLYQVNYITSTNPTGIALLKDYLVKRISDLGAEPVNLRGVNDDGELLEIITTLKDQPLTVETLPYLRTRKIGRSKNKSSSRISPHTYIIPPGTDAFAAIDLEPDELLSFLKESHLNNNNSGVVLLLYLNAEYDWPRIWGPLRDIINTEGNKQSILICTTEETAASMASSFNEKNLVTLANNLSKEIAATILIHSNIAFAISQRGKFGFINFTDHLGTAEIARCLAGIFVSTVATEFVKQLNGPEVLRTNPFEQLVLGYSWASCPQSNGGFTTEDGLLRFLRLIDGSPFSELNQRITLQDEDFSSSFTTRNYTLLKQLEQVYRATSDKEVIKELFRSVQDKHELVVSAAVDRLQQIGGLTDLPRPVEERVIFIDLDLTLFDYEAAREEGAEVALRELPLAVPMSDLVRIYKRIVNHWAAFDLLGFPNMRHIWNEEIIYYLTYLLASEFFVDRSLELFELLAEIEMIENQSSQTQVLFERSKIGRDFMEALRLVQTDVQLQQDVRRAYIQFEKATEQLEPFKETREVLTTLSKIEGYHVYVVTEGDSRIQWEKIEKLGLQDLVSSTSLIVADEYTNLHFLLNSLYRANNQLRLQLSGNRSEERLKLERETIKFCQRFLRYFRRKKDGHFYRHALHIAVKNMYGQRNEMEFDNVAATVWDNLRPIKVATVGDRLTNDILPLLQLLGSDKLLSVHMLFGKYMDEKIPEGSPSPDFTITRLIKARNILLQDRFWSVKSPIGRPRHLGIELSEDDMIYTLIGLTMAAPISSMAEALLEDRGFSESIIEDLQQRATEELKVMESSVPLRTRIKRILPFTD